MLTEREFLDDFFIKHIEVVFSVFVLPQPIRGGEGRFRVTAYEGATRTACHRVCDFRIGDPKADWAEGLPRQWDRDLILEPAQRIATELRSGTRIPDA
ncbi:hypothetical protein [Glycomyces xiaoerkulensis]|uniref:hypothetical protein n=1 Tax=Glycomyces xiaoerkulensis TaxID=2038139 RepID=UPI000C2636F2|nr:hypothetical protein [Glycomyces xiaoerkulensis]